MRFTSVEITNLRALRHVELKNLGDLVLIAGPNGVGKSCVLDGLRLLKSMYGGYQPNEARNWFNEFQLPYDRDSKNLLKIFRDRNAPVKIQATVELALQEKSFLRENAESLLRQFEWKLMAQKTQGIAEEVQLTLGRLNKEAQETIDERANEYVSTFLEQLDSDFQEAQIEISPTGDFTYNPNLVLEVAWGTFDSENIGIIDFHNAHRTYSYEKVGNINLNIKETDQRIKNHALYNTQSKYSNVKAEMAAAYVRELIVKEAASGTNNPSVLETLQELFLRFFPGKEFLGAIPQADGSLSFPVKITSDGSEHDVDFLSSGEKEVLFGYLRLRNSAPRNSIIMIDEPELHLNPRLVKGLPSFYHEYIGKALSNQVWLVTHSDTFLRDARNIPGATVWHLREWVRKHGDQNQAVLVSRESDIERAVFDLVGDTGYRPGARVVIVEGEDSEFDREMITRLFPKFAASVNIISAGGRSRVEKLQELLNEATSSVGWEARFVAITDRDIDQNESPTSGTEIGIYKWDCYHVENYLLEAKFIFKVLQDAGEAKGRVSSRSGVQSCLLEIAKSKVNEMVRLHLSNKIHRALHAQLKLRIGADQNDIATAFAVGIAKTESAISALSKGDFSESKIRLEAARVRKLHNDYIKKGTWTKHFRGRDILREFAGKHSSLKYEIFRNFVISGMCDAKFEPKGMRKTVKKVFEP